MADYTLKTAGLTELFLWMLRRRRRFRVAGNSMLPLLSPGDEVLVDPAAYRTAPPRPGDLVIAQHPTQPDLRMVKRVESVVNKSQFVLLGDNAAESTDSRVFGTVTAAHILGKVMCVFGHRQNSNK